MHIYGISRNNVYFHVQKCKRGMKRKLKSNKINTFCKPNAIINLFNFRTNHWRIYQRDRLHCHRIIENQKAYNPGNLLSNFWNKHKFFRKTVNKQKRWKLKRKQKEQRWETENSYVLVRYRWLSIWFQDHRNASCTSSYIKNMPPVRCTNCGT